MNHFLFYYLGSVFGFSICFDWVLSWFTFVLFNNDCFKIALNFVGANILYGNFLGSSIFRPVNSLML